MQIGMERVTKFVTNGGCSLYSGYSMVRLNTKASYPQLSWDYWKVIVFTSKSECTMPI